MSLTVNFVNRSLGGATYHWDFGDGSSSNLASPSHTYLQAGAYVATLTTTSAGGQVGSISKVVTVTGDIGLTEFVATSGLDILATSGGDALILP